MLCAGDHFDRYVIEGILGEGGMGIVYRALDPKLGRRVALKVVSLADGGSKPDAAARLVREARAAAAFDHPNTVSIFDVGEVDGTPYLAMELVSGKTFRAFIGDPSVPFVTRIGWLTDVARALAAGHRAGLVHRDVKPENVMVRDDGVVKVLDFGIARQARSGIDPTAQTAHALATITAEGVAVGTPLYMAPEQLRGERVDGRSDQFSWGVVAYELLTGRSPWARASDLLALAAAISSQDADPAALSSTGVSQVVSALVMRALRKGAGDRLPSMDAIVEILDAERTGAKPVAATSVSPRVPHRKQRVLALSVLMAALAALVAARLTRSRASAPATVDAAVETAVLPPVPSVGKPEAIEAYREALAAWRGAEGTRFHSLMQKALDLDPSLSEALTRTSVTIDYDRPSPVRDRITRAGAHRDTLAPRDAALLKATEALYAHDPLDRASFLRMLAFAVDQAPRDADLRALLAETLETNGELDEASRQIDRVLTLDPGFAQAWALRVLVAGARGDGASVRKIAADCVARFPRATDCIDALVTINSNAGNCAEVESESRDELAVDPSSAMPFQSLYMALAAEGRPREMVDAAFEQYVQRLGPASRDDARIAGGWQVDVLYGAFETADRKARELSAAKPADLELGRMALFRRLSLADEEGDRAAAIALFREALLREPTWSSAGEQQHGGVLVMGFRNGAIDRETFDRELASWRPRVAAMIGDAPTERAALDEYRFLLWVAQYGEVAVSQSDVDAALQRFDDEKLAPSTGNSSTSGVLGELLVRGGRAAAAVPHLRRATSLCDVMEDPDGLVRGALHLGEALEATNDLSGACAAYARVLGYWGRAHRSITASEARANSAKLACPAAK